MTDDPGHADHADHDPQMDDFFGTPPEALRALTERSRQRLDSRTPEQLVGELFRTPYPHIVNPMEMNRRLMMAVVELTTHLKKAQKSADRLGKILVWLTGILVILTAVILYLTFKLASQ